MRSAHTLSNAAVLGVLVAAVELPVRWNELGAANRVDSSAQAIPLLVSVGVVARVTYLHYVDDGDDDDDERSATTERRTSADRWAVATPRQMEPAHVRGGPGRAAADDGELGGGGNAG